MSNDFIGKILALSCAFIWAFAVILFKRSGESMPPFVLNLFKSSVAGIVMLPLWFFMDDPMIPDSLTMQHIVWLALSGIVGITVADTLFFVCLNKLGAGYYAIIDCAYSPSMIFFSWLILSEPLTIVHFLGAVCVICAVLVITFEKKIDRTIPVRDVIVGSAAGVLAIVLMVISIIAVKPILDQNSAILITQCRMLPAAIVLNVVALCRKNRKSIYRLMVRPMAFRMALPGAILGNVLSMLAWITAFKYTDMGSASILNQMTVIFVVVLASLFLGESLSFRRVIATFLGFSGAVIVLSGCAGL